MSAPTADIVLTRLISYVRLAGVDVDDALLFELTDIVREGCTTNVSNLFSWCVKRLNGRLCSTQPTIAPPLPPLLRGHIGYDGQWQRER